MNQQILPISILAGRDRTLLTWLLGGGISLIGALCYAELATTYPHAGGNYYYLIRWRLE
jgi:amino acid transporter